MLDDLRELTARNAKKIGFDVSSLANQMSKDISGLYFGKISYSLSNKRNNPISKNELHN